MRYLHAGETGLVVELGNEISPEINNKIKQLVDFLDRRNDTGIIEILPTYRSLLITYNPLEISFGNLKEIIELAFKKSETNESKSFSREIVEIPVFYGGELGPDLDFVANYNQLSSEEVVKIHSSEEYLIYMIGFTPGFPYVGGMSEKISTPRLQTPRTQITAGSVGIAANQTGIYPVESPGGWQLIGRTPLRLFDYRKENPFLLDAGHYLSFKPIDQNEFKKISNEVSTGTYKITRLRKEE